MSQADFEVLVSDSSSLDLRGFHAKANEEFHVREFLDEMVYSDSMLNTILGPVAIYSWQEEKENVDIIRFNEQFYEAVNVPDFHDRLNSIQRFMPSRDFLLMKETMAKAIEDGLNGANTVLSFFRTDGSAARFLIHFYYLGQDGSSKRFYGSARNISQIAKLQTHMELISRYFPECVIFLSKIDQHYIHQVVAYGLEEEFGMSRETFEEELTSGLLYDRILPEHRQMLHRQALDAMMGIDFSSYFSMIRPDGKRVNLFMKTDCIDDETSSVQCLVIISRRQAAE